jgi:hypothetical protein
VASTLTTAHAAVFAAVSGLSGFSGIIDHEVTPDQMPTPTALTVSPGGKTATDYNIFARVWSSTQADPDGASVALDTLTEAVEAAMPSAFVLGEWVVQFSPDHTAWVSQSTISVPRTDF